MFLLQDWTTTDGNGTAPFVQGRAAWLDLARFADVTFWLEVRAVTKPGAGNVTLKYETAPAMEEELFQPLASLTLAAATTPVITTARLGNNPAIPLGRWVRWKLEGSAAGSWSVTFRIFVSAGKGAAGFDPSSLALTGWWRAGDYNGNGTWAASPSAGSSGGRDLFEGTSPPTGGPSLNGFGTVSFARASSQRLTNSNNVRTVFFTASAGSTWALVKSTSEDTNAIPPSVYLNDAVWCDSAAIVGTHLRSGGPNASAFFDDATAQQYAAEAAFADGAWQLVQTKWDGTNIKVRVNSGIWTSSSAGTGTMHSSAGSLRVGMNSGTAFFDGLIAEIGFIDSALPDATFDSIKTYINGRYGLSL